MAKEIKHHKTKFNFEKKTKDEKIKHYKNYTLEESKNNNHWNVKKN